MRYLFTCCVIIICGYGCREQVVEPPQHKPTITLTSEHVGITETALRIHFTDSIGSRAFRLTRNNQVLLAALISSFDTLMTDTTLLRGRTYTYKAYRLNGPIVVDSSETVNVHTIDSASIVISTVQPYVVEADIGITMNDRNPIRDYKITRDGQIISFGYLAGKDTTIIDTGLLPAHVYTYTMIPT